MIRELNWLGGEHDFALRIGELRALQDKLDAGPEEVLNRLRFGTWRIDDLIEVVRLGLIGAEMDKDEAKALVMKVFDLHPPIAFKLVALRILSSELLGIDGDPVGEPDGVAGAPENGNSAGSTDPAPQ